MQGPTTAVTGPPSSVRRAATAAGTTPATRPRQPAWTTPTDAGVGGRTGVRTRRVHDDHAVAVHLAQPRPRVVHEGAPAPLDARGSRTQVAVSAVGETEGWAPGHLALSLGR